MSESLQSFLPIPRRWQHLIERPLTHYLGHNSPGVTRGYLIFVFNNQMFRHDIEVPLTGTIYDKDTYAREVEKGIEHINEMVLPVLLTLGLDRFEHDV